MKHCEPCDLDFPDAYRFCGSCGGSLRDSRRCAHCGELVEGKWTFCTGCGKSLSAESTINQTTQSESPEQTDLPASHMVATPDDKLYLACSGVNKVAIAEVRH